MAQAAKALLLFLLLICFMAPAGFADSVWKDSYASPYSTNKSFKIGDVITVIILESTTAQQKAGTDTSARDDLSAKFEHTITKINKIIPPSGSGDATWSNKYKGLGQTTRSSVVQTKVSAVVTEVMDNGTLKLEGKHYVKVNDETQQVSLAGIIRAKDVTLLNTVFSYQVANADISVLGAGTVGSAQQPGIVTRFINWIF